jgi:hypothetical protein
MEAALAELHEAVSQGRCVLVVGTGVSSAVSGEAKASWHGLLGDAIVYTPSVRPVEGNWSAEMRTRLTEADDSAAYLELASDLVAALGGSASPDFAQWLRRSVGYLEPRNPEVAEILTSFDFPIVTTNYDDLLERVSGRDHVTWQDAAQFQRVLLSQSNDIAHLHGHWRRADSIVFTAEQYELMMADKGAMALRNAMAAVNTMIYVGFGEGLSDPNFANLRAWISDTLPYQEVRHFRLCLSSQREALLRDHAESGDRILPVAYGDSHTDLAEFLRELRRSAGSSPLELGTPMSALEVLEEEVRDSAVLVAHLRDPDAARVPDMLIPPVLLPMPHTQYVAAVKEDADSRPQRCDLTEELERDRLIVVGEEHVGVTSALLWLAAQHSVKTHTLIPVKVDFRKVGAGHGPLRREVWKQLRAAGRRVRPADPLPDLILVLDNLNASNPRRLERVVEELDDSSYKKILIGARTGTELELVRLLDQQGAYDRYALRYIGRLAVPDVKQLSGLIAAPARAETLTTAAAAVVRAHRLPSTPFTFSMIISAILRGESLMAAASPTALLDAYLDLLLGRGATDDDSRLGMDAFGRAYVLSKLAQEFVLKRTGALAQGQAIDLISRVFDELDWDESPVDVVKDLQARHVLLINGGDVAFSQSSYLHVFAAKRAQEDAEFLEHLKADPVYYAPILNHYAALKRTDAKLLVDLLPLLDKFDQYAGKTANAFTDVVVGTVEGARQDEDGREDAPLEDRIAHEANAVRDAPDADAVDPLDEREDDDRVPFPLEPVGDEPTVLLQMQSLDLLSSLLRDTEVISDHELKESYLTRLLLSWALLVARLEAETGDAASLRDALAHAAEQIGIPEKKLERFLADMMRLLPLSIALSGLSLTLSSRKLVRTVERCLRREELATNAGFAILATYMLIDVKAAHWPSKVSAVLERHGETIAVTTVFRRLMFSAYLSGTLSPDDEREVLDLLVEQTLRLEGLDASRREWIRSQFKRQKLTSQTKERFESQGGLDDNSLI